MIQVGDIIVSAECITQKFCCDLADCHGICCVEGEAGAPVTEEEIAQIEEALPAVSDKLDKKALRVIEKQGVAYVDSDGDLVTSIVDGKDCVFTCKGDGGCCMCALERAHAEGKTDFVKPISCALYPIRVTRLGDGTLALNYHRWSVCRGAKGTGQEARHRRVRVPARTADTRLWPRVVRRTRNGGGRDETPALPRRHGVKHRVQHAVRRPQKCCPTARVRICLHF